MTERSRAKWTSRDIIPCWENGVDCTERHPGCQDTCERMKAAKAKNEARKAIEREVRKREGIANEYEIKKAIKHSGKKPPQK